MKPRQSERGSSAPTPISPGSLASSPTSSHTRNWRCCWSSRTSQSRAWHRRAWSVMENGPFVLEEEVKHYKRRKRWLS